MRGLEFPQTPTGHPPKMRTTSNMKMNTPPSVTPPVITATTALSNRVLSAITALMRVMMVYPKKHSHSNRLTGGGPCGSCGLMFRANTLPSSFTLDDMVGDHDHHDDDPCYHDGRYQVLTIEG